jgi:hypothetical protein
MKSSEAYCKRVIDGDGKERKDSSCDSEFFFDRSIGSNSSSDLLDHSHRKFQLLRSLALSSSSFSPSSLSLSIHQKMIINKSNTQ